MSRVRRAAAAIAPALALLAAPTAGAGQTCGLVTGAGAAVGVVSYPVSGGITGVAAGVDGTFEVADLVVRAGYRHVLLRGDAADPDVVRAAAAYPVIQVGRVVACASAHGGVSRFSYGGDAGAVLAGGIGATVAAATVGPIVPYATVRGLGGYATGTVLGLTVDAGGLAVGVEAGVAALFGPLAIRLTGTLDGFDDGLGVTPFPGASLELGLDYRF